MDYLKIIGETLFILVLLMMVLELVGRKSITYFNIIQVVVFISMGEVILLPVFDKTFKITEMATIVLTLIAFMIIVEWLQLKLHWLEAVLNKKAVVVIKDGKLVHEQLKKQRLTVDQLEMKLRVKGIKNYEELEIATLESTGEIGYKYKEDYAPITKQDLKIMLGKEVDKSELKGNDMFDELIEGHSIPHNKKLN